MLVRILLMLALVSCGWTQTHLTDLMTPEQFHKAGLNKLTPEELRQLNSWMASALTALTAPKSSAAPGLSVGTEDTSEPEISLFDSSGTPIAYLATDDEMTIYLWSGTPVAYLDDENIYGFNGNHLGWLKDGIMYDHKGDVVGATKNNFSTAVKTEPFKGFKKFKPFRAFQKFAPFEPFHHSTWSRTPMAAFLGQGRN
jgi:hypothetical protein